LLRFANNKAELSGVADLLASKLQGNILFQAHNQTTLICTDLERQTSQEYVVTKTKELKDAYLKYVHFLDTDFAENRRVRREGQQDEARARQLEYLAAYNQKGWVQYMRARQNIHPDVQIVPGMHAEAETQSQVLHQTAPCEEEQPLYDTAYPDAARKKGQRYAAVSMLLDDTQDMEVLLFVHAVYGDVTEAKEHVESELSELLHPLPIDVVDMYEWIFPVRMQWENNHLSQRVAGLDETWNNVELGKAQQERLEAAKKNRNIKRDVLKKKEMDAGVQAQIAEHLGVTGDDLMRILDKPEYGAEAVIKWVQMDNEDERKALAAAAIA